MNKNELAVKKKDRDTGEVVMVTPEMEQRLRTIEFSLVSNWVQIALSIKTIRDEKLYLVRTESWTDYVQGYLRESFGLSERHVRRHLQVATAYSEKVMKSASKGAPMQALIDLSRDPELVRELNEGNAEIDGDRVVYEDGTFESLEKVRERVKNDTAEKFRKKLDDMDARSKGRDSIISDFRKRTEEQAAEIEKLKEYITTISQNKIEPGKLLYIKHKKDAIDLIRESQETFIKIMGDLTGVPDDLIDADVAGHIAASIAMISAGAVRLRDRYGALTWIPKIEGDPIDADVVPE